MSFSNVCNPPHNLTTEDVKSGLPVKGTTWLSAAEVANYLNGNEISLVSAMAYPYPSFLAISEAAATEIRFMIYPRTQIRHLLWVVSFVTGDKDFDVSGNDTAFDSTGTIQIGSGTTYNFTISDNKPCVLYILDDELEGLSTPTEQTITLDLGLGDDLVIEQIAAYQIRRRGLDPEAATTEYAADNDSCGSGAVIKDVDEYSIGGVVDAISTAKENARRASMFAWSSLHSWVYVGQGTSWNNLFFEDPEVLARYVSPDVSTTAVRIDVLARLGSATDTSFIKFVASSGDTATISIPVAATAATAGTWYNTFVDVYTEALSDSKGRRSGADRIAISVWGSGNTTETSHFAIGLRAIIIGEA